MNHTDAQNKAIHGKLKSKDVKRIHSSIMKNVEGAKDVSHELNAWGQDAKTAKADRKRLR